MAPIVSSTMQFRCTKSGRMFDPGRGGHCHVCTKLFCDVYLQRDARDADKRLICDDCLEKAGGKPGRLKKFWKWPSA